MRSIRPSRRFVYAFTLAVILLSQRIIPQVKSPSHPTPNGAATSSDKPNRGKVNCNNNGAYVNSKGQTVQRPETCSAPPQGATAHCRDGTYSFSRNRRGTCSHHGGVGKWL